MKKAGDDMPSEFLLKINSSTGLKLEVLFSRINDKAQNIDVYSKNVNELKKANTKNLVNL